MEVNIIKNKVMKVKRIEESSVTEKDIKSYTESISKLNGVVFTAADVNMNKRIVTVRIGSKEDELTLVNPKVIESADKFVVYFEIDDRKKTVRKTKRSPYLVVETENLGKIEFKAEKEHWKDADEFMTDAGLAECVLVQRAIDAIDGITITDKNRKYSDTIVSNYKPGRNEKILMETDTGEMLFVKSKKATIYESQGYKIL